MDTPKRISKAERLWKAYLEARAAEKKKFEERPVKIPMGVLISALSALRDIATRPIPVTAASIADAEWTRARAFKAETEIRAALSVESANPLPPE